MNSKKYIGLDAHSSTCNFCVLDATGVILDQRKIVTNGRVIRDYLESIKGTLILTFEECNLSTWLVEILKTTVTRIVVCNPAYNKKYKEAKTDRIDAYNLAQLLRGGFLKSVYHDGTEREKLRVLVSGYIDLVSDMTRSKNRYKALLRHEGISAKRKESDTDKIDKNARFVLRSLAKQVRTELELKQEYVQEIKCRVKKFKEARCLMSLVGIKEIRAAKIIAQVINPHRFRNKHKYYSYCGLVQHPRMSGGKQYGSEIIWGNRTLKCVYKMAGRSALQGNNKFRQYYDGLRERGISDANAYNAVCRKIAATSLSLWKNMQMYKEDKIKTV